MGLKDSTKNNRYKRTVQRTMSLKDSTKNNGFKEQYKKQTNFGKNYQKVPIN